MVRFADMNLSPKLLQALGMHKHVEATPIQEKAIPFILAGNDFLGIAQTGTGKTAAFTLPILQKLLEAPSSRQIMLPQALILVPTRELAIQTLNSLKRYGSQTILYFGAIYGGVNEKPQIRSLRDGVDILVATPGRLIDLFRRKSFSLNGIRFCVIDEADRMLDMGFLPSIRMIMNALPQSHQTLLFSATLPQEIESLIKDFLRNPVRVEITPPATTAITVEQNLLFIPKSQKLRLLQYILANEACKHVIIFSKTKYGADYISRHLRKASIDNCVLHGDKTQAQRQNALKRFRQGNSNILIATDVASRGIDISQVTHVINFDLPNEPESYIHRIGRTGRAGRIGVAYSFCDASEKPLLHAIEKKIQRPIPILSVKRFWPNFIPIEQPAVFAKKPSHISKRTKDGLRSFK